jgi:hypothetical protein
VYKGSDSKKELRDGSGNYNSAVKFSDVGKAVEKSDLDM